LGTGVKAIARIAGIGFLVEFLPAGIGAFAAHHFWSPRQLVARILGFGPTVYGVRWKQNVYLGMVVHCSLNSFAVLLVAAMVFGRV
jgi:hypothetical protein